MNYVLGIDVGTSGTKTALFDLNGNTVACETSEYELSQPQNGWAEQNPEDWWSAAASTIKAVVNKSGVSAEKISGIGLTGQMHGLVMLDEHNRVLRPAIIWCDQRTAQECEEIERKLGRERLIEITANPALTGFTASKIMWVKKHEPEIYAKCRHILLPKDYIRFMLTGEYATDVSDASGMQLLDVPNRCWSQDVLEALDIDASLLAKVYESVEISGYVTKTAAEKTGLKSGIPVAAGAGDNAAAAIGMGVIENGKAFTTIGTSGVVFMHTEMPLIDAKGRMHTFCSAVPGKWHVMGVTQSAGLSLKWFRDNFCKDIIAQAETMDIDPYVIMDKGAAQSALGANRLLFLPYLMGERTPHLDADARGVFFGISAIHTRDDFIRAILEGVGFSLNDCLFVFHEMSLDVNEMLVCGGGGKSRLWRSILADIFGCDIFTAKSNEGPALGAAILAMVCSGLYGSVSDACKNIVKADEITNYSLENHSKYLGIYEIYKSIYPSIKNNYKQLSEMGE